MVGDGFAVVGHLAKLGGPAGFFAGENDVLGTGVAVEGQTDGACVDDQAGGRASFHGVMGVGAEDDFFVHGRKVAFDIFGGCPDADAFGV